MAKMVAWMAFGVAHPGVEQHDVSARFEQEGSPASIMGMHSRVVENYVRSVDSKLKQIEALRKEIEILEFRNSAINTYSINCVAE
jgi:hypothetical protein